MGTTFRTWLAEAMQQRNLTTMKLAVLADVPDRTVEDWLAGRRVPTPEEAGQLSAALDLPAITVLRQAGYDV